MSDETPDQTALITLLLLGSALNAQADNDIYNNTLKQARGDDALHVDTQHCSQMLGAPQNGTPTSRAYKRCMPRLALRSYRARAQRKGRHVSRS
ncbi:MAG: hypothetical protein KGK01_18580 [Bradyrhizobium sp.]|uniref:hypothetical protein n=1 Tax=Bradyrhizobium sp. TaxID=376 RepID=UPI001C29C27C|nr:hypothetical protein [Bradyrhizobium sp.]MBU6462049.1 hypothetical protein [Pseudomonadota bacterium]MDE2066454.1 hypothetical protein [Bradyrhizobium sp.]MDE2244352.1 hypothetical protein [Bradyrhizobium sp.]MDE2467285.1 hypothetical protein [Bradyrhizobium sp.]